MKKFMYLSLTGLMVLSPTTRCMEQQIEKADKEASTCEAVPTKEELVAQFRGAALAVSQLSRLEVAGSGSFNTMKNIYATLKKVNEGDKEKTRADLDDGYCSEDENYYTTGIEDANVTLQKISSLNMSSAYKYQPKLEANQKRATKLNLEKESLTNSIEQLIIKRNKINSDLSKNAQEEVKLKDVLTIFSNNKAQEISLLNSRKEKLTRELQEIDELLKKEIITVNELLDKHEVTESLLESPQFAISEELRKKLSEDKAALQKKLNAVDAALASLNPPQAGWFNWNK